MQQVPYSSSTFSSHDRRPKNLDVILALLHRNGPMRVKTVLVKLAECGHRLSRAANPLKAVSNEIAVMRNRGAVVKVCIRQALGTTES